MNQKTALRYKIFNKYNGHCAYCGCKLEKGWHIDEIKPVIRTRIYVESHWLNTITKEKSKYLTGSLTDRVNWKHVSAKWKTAGCRNPENFNYNNQNPACASCNINKHQLSLEEFRHLIQGFMKHLNELNTQYKIAKRYGLVVENIQPVKFYFETI